MAALDGANERFGRETVQLAAAMGQTGGGLALWQGQAAWHTLAYTTRLERLLVVNLLCSDGLEPDVFRFLVSMSLGRFV